MSNILTRIPIDKQSHALGGAVIALALGYAFPAYVGIAAAVVAGALKEAYDRLHPDTHTVDKWDFIATSLGGIAGGLFVFAIGAAQHH